MKFWKENSYWITKLMINQVGIIIFSAVMNLTAASMGEELKGPMTLVAGIFAVCFYMFLVFYAMREAGTKDSVRIEGGRIAYDPIYGLKVGAFASIINYIPVLLMWIGFIIFSVSSSGSLFGVGYLLSNLIFQNMFTGILKPLFTALSLTESYLAASLAFTVTPVFAMLASFLGYRFGISHPIRKK